MKRKSLRFSPFWILIALLGMGLVTPVHAQRYDIPKPSGQWVTDLGSMLEAADEQALSRKLAGYADTTSTQIIIVTLPTLDGVPAADYAVELGRQWGVGQEGRNNGVVILLSREDRQVFIATGFGLEGAIPDAIASRIVRNVMVPRFREGRFYDGLSQAVDALMQAARGEYAAEPRQVRGRDGGGVNLTTLYILLIIIFFVISSMRRGGGGGKGGGGRRYRRPGIPPVILWGSGLGGSSRGGGGGFGGFGGGGFGGGGFGGGGGSFGGGGAGGSW